MRNLNAAAPVVYIHSASYLKIVQYIGASVGDPPHLREAVAAVGAGVSYAQENIAGKSGCLLSRLCPRNMTSYLGLFCGAL